MTSLLGKHYKRSNLPTTWTTTPREYQSMNRGGEGRGEREWIKGVKWAKQNKICLVLIVFVYQPWPLPFPPDCMEPSQEPSLEVANKLLMAKERVYVGWLRTKGSWWEQWDLDGNKRMLMGFYGNKRNLIGARVAKALLPPLSHPQRLLVVYKHFAPWICLFLVWIPWWRTLDEHGMKTSCGV